ncbi:MAG: hypothetical protein ACTSUE_14065 [Promethearchaeota archaeon]
MLVTANGEEYIRRFKHGEYDIEPGVLSYIDVRYISSRLFGYLFIGHPRVPGREFDKKE